MKKTILTLTAATFLFAACSDSSNQEATTEAPTTTEAPAAPTAPAATGAAELTLNAGDDMKFDVTDLTVKAGQTVKLTLNHTGKAPAAAMGHNFVLLADGTDMEAFAKAAIAAKDNDYIPKDMESSVIAHTKTIGGGESTQIEFPAPAAGTYQFLCSFPGHHGTMQGTLTVE